MFRKLKQKIQEEDLTKQQVIDGSVVVSGDRQGLSKSTTANENDSRNGTIASTQERTSDDSQVNSQIMIIRSDVAKGFSITDSPTSPIRVTDSAIADGSDSKTVGRPKTPKEGRPLKSKPPVAHEKQPSATDSRRSEKKETEWRNKLTMLEKEAADWKAKYEESIDWKEKYLRDHEAVEELEDFQTQELAKVKHLLLISQKDLQERTVTLSERDDELSALRTSCGSLNDELNQIREEHARLKVESARFKEKSDSNDRSVAEWRELNDVVCERLSDLNRQLEEKDDRLGQAQRQLADVSDELTALKHGYEVQTKRDRLLLDEKDSTIANLESRLRMLERRLADADLGGDDRLVKMSAERDAFESELNECKQHLAEIKCTWSEKIEALENQIAHLNAKMAEDNEEAACRERADRQLREDLDREREQLGVLRLSYSVLEGRLGELVSEKNADAETSRQQIEALVARLADVDAEKNRLASELRGELMRLEESRMAELKGAESRETDLVTEKAAIMKVCDTQKEEIDDLSRKMIGSNARIAELCESKSKLEDELHGTKLRLEEITKDRDALKIELRSLEDEVRTTREERRAGVDVQQLQCALQKAEEETRSLQQLEVNRQSTSDAVEAENVKLKAAVALLETQLADRNKAVKLQRQRLGDMKKALQRELQSAGRPSNADLDSDLDGGSNRSEVSPAVTAASAAAATAATTTTTRAACEMSLNDNGSIGRHQCSSLADKLDDINFRYVKHVIFKFMTSTEYEANQLIRAIGVLLDFSRDEERLVRDTLNWKASWFGTKPQVVSRSRVSNRTVI